MQPTGRRRPQLFLRRALYIDGRADPTFGVGVRDGGEAGVTVAGCDPVGGGVPGGLRVGVRVGVDVPDLTLVGALVTVATGAVRAGRTTRNPTW